MIDEPIVRWVFTVVFVGLALYSAVHVFTTRSHPAQLISHTLHVVMSADMAAMAWPWWTFLPGTPQLVIFGVATGWFALIFLVQCLRPSGYRDPQEHGPWYQVMHTVMMLAMVWMVATMTGANPTTSGHDHSSMTPVTAVSGVLLTGSLIVATMISAAELVTGPRSSEHAWATHAREVGANGLMCLGMTSMCLPMLVG
ncbi:MAG: DUF5134 domain-containing protein [Brevibacterium sp.]|uniref:DUF5134 domain-containing protein n=1 Tax=Brevibacterium sp. TaxID=1701 RepID=UPI0026489CE4|nr:DUF5134 domain-containing protein [Brevibacterium sp.]MDN5833228.1 DUF5134 domain-containing protein [Brevibacterium sp.]MDN5875850.1 DUF5134 domain-containing protein [Brevibacterium sp.]MDN5908189.1 DUF5134 domain-containing protein [Brevibacterium sp.]MDN6132831.1 DUF5134 domain-containing protein [Brevibacterium sp.]MDN6157167.1 DUF5134 domain-containing protein [Brevibacterium sp.]